MPRWEPNARMRLVEAALELFEEQGYDATAVAEIADRGGLTKTTFFRHFPDKREVLFAGQEDHRRLLADGVAAAPADATPREAVGSGIAALAASFGPERRAFAARVSRVVREHDELRERAGAKRTGYADALEGALRERGEAETTSSVAAGLGVLAFYAGYDRWLAGEGEELPALVDAALADVAQAATAAVRRGAR